MLQQTKLFESLKTKGLFWSYAGSVKAGQIGDDVLIEQTLRYGDFDDIKAIFGMFDREKIFCVWERELKNDLRFKKSNLLLARVFFGLDVESDYFTGGMSDREKKLRMLASQN